MADILVQLRAQAKMAKEQGLQGTHEFLSQAADELEQARFLLRLAEAKLKRPPKAPANMNGHANG